MRFIDAPVILAIALVLGACAHSSRWANAPQANGSVGAVVVRSEGSATIVLDKPYAAARIAGAGRVQPLTYDADFAKKEFSATLAALPVRPITFLLYFLEGKDEFTPDSEREV